MSMVTSGPHFLPALPVGGIGRTSQRGARIHRTHQLAPARLQIRARAGPLPVTRDQQGFSKIIAVHSSATDGAHYRATGEHKSDDN
jgi:hypothetical protein